MTALTLALLLAPDIESGPKAGEKVPALKAFGLVGAVEGKETDYAADRKELPTVYLFVQNEHFTRPMARFMKTLDGKVTESAEKAAVVAVWVGAKDTFAKTKERLPVIQNSIKLEHTAYAAFDGDKSGPDGWAINPDAHLTVVVVVKGKVTKSFPLVSVNDTDARPVLAELKTAAGK